MVGTAICLVIERDPIVTAKQVASVDRLSGGRMLFGVGAGWNLEEMENHGTDPSRRFGRMRESVEAMKEIWANDEAEYHGEQIEFDPIWCWPKPLTEPHPPILVGGHGKKVLDRVLAYGDEWLPNRIGDDERIAARIARLRKAGRGRRPRADPDDARERERRRPRRPRALRGARASTAPSSTSPRATSPTPSGGSTATRRGAGHTSARGRDAEAAVPRPMSFARRGGQVGHLVPPARRSDK